MDEFLRLAIGKAHYRRLAGGIGDRALRTGGDAGDPFAADLGQGFGSVADTGDDLAVLAAGDQPGLALVERRAEQAVVDGSPFMPMVEAVDRPVGKREMRHAAEKDGGDAMSVEVKRSDCRHW